MKAYSTRTNTTYPSWEDLLKAESNGWLAITLITSNRNGKTLTWPWITGPYTEKKDARNAINRMKTRIKKDAWQYPHQTYNHFVRPAWKEV